MSDNHQLSSTPNDLSSYPVYALIDNDILDNHLNLPILNKQKVSPITILQNKEILKISCTGETCFILTKEEYNKIYKCGPKKEDKFEEFTFHVTFQNQLNKTFEKSVINMESGGSHTLFLTKEGFVFGLGNNNYQQLGFSLNLEIKQTPTEIIGLKNIISIQAGVYHSLFLNKFNEIFICGNNNHNQIGKNYIQEGVFKKIILNSNLLKENEYIIDIECGMNHSLFLSNLGNVYGVGSADCFCLASSEALVPFCLELPFLESNERWEMFSDVYFYGSFFVKKKTSKNLLQFYFRLKESVKNNLLTDIYFY
ncbi:hypothetical protein ABK040_006974 [Willaertia magna]